MPYHRQELPCLRRAASCQCQEAHPATCQCPEAHPASCRCRKCCPVGFCHRREGYPVGPDCPPPPDRCSPSCRHCRWKSHRHSVHIRRHLAHRRAVHCHHRQSRRAVHCH